MNKRHPIVGLFFEGAAAPGMVLVRSDEYVRIVRNVLRDMRLPDSTRRGVDVSVHEVPAWVAHVVNAATHIAVDRATQAHYGATDINVPVDQRLFATRLLRTLWTGTAEGTEALVLAHSPASLVAALRCALAHQEDRHE